MQKPRDTWDTRGQLIGILGGTASGSRAAWSVYFVSQNQIDALPHFAPHWYTDGEIISASLNIVMTLVLPGLSHSLTAGLGRMASCGAAGVVSEAARGRRKGFAPAAGVSGMGKTRMQRRGRLYEGIQALAKYVLVTNNALILSLSRHML